MSPEGSDSQQTNESSSGKDRERAIFEQAYDGRVADHRELPTSEDPDLTLDVPSLEIEELNLDVENLRARISVQAELADMVKLNVGLEADVDKLKLEAKGVEAQVLLKAGLDNVRAILSQALDALDNNPGILEDLVRGAGEASAGTTGGTRQALEGPSSKTRDETDQGAGEGGDEDIEKVDAGGEPNATGAARQKAEDLGVELSNVKGTGSGGRILVRDVKKAAR